MSWVRARRWTYIAGSGRWHKGKVHWMVRPWVTLCGHVVTDDWIDVGWPWRERVCKRCGETRAEVSV